VNRLSWEPRNKFLKRYHSWWHPKIFKVRTSLKPWTIFTFFWGMSNTSHNHLDEPNWQVMTKCFHLILICVSHNEWPNWWWKPCQTLFYKKHPRKGEKWKQGVRTEVQASKQPNKGGPQGGKGTTKNWTLHKSHEANQLKKGEVNLIKLLA
jgi:hypothetical protein